MTKETEQFDLEESEVESVVDEVVSEEADEVIETDESWDETPGMTEASGFDLDFGILDEPVEEPTEVQEESIAEEQEETTDDSYVTEDSLPFAGVFGGLRSRRKIVNKELDQIPEGQFKATEKGTAFWTAEEAITVAEDVIDEIEPTPIDEFEVSNNDEIDPTELYEMQPNEDISIDSNVIKSFTRLLTQVLQPSNSHVGGNQDLIDQLRAISRPRLTEKEEHVLSIAVLSALSASESVVVAEAKGRTISPSDKALLGRLSIKRARLSQICNRLHKAGILHARMVGRSRMFGLTRSALAQLIAWGIVGGDE